MKRYGFRRLLRCCRFVVISRTRVTLRRNDVGGMAKKLKKVEFSTAYNNKN